MSHEFVAGVRVEGSDKSWHGLENTIPADKAHDLGFILKEVGISTVRSLPLMGVLLNEDGSIKQVFETDQIGLYDETDTHLGTHGADSYHIHQAYDVLKPAFDIIEAMDGKLAFDFGCRLRGGRVFTMNFVLNEETKILGEKHRNYLNFSSSFDGTLASKAGGTSVREVCMNTVAMSNSLVSTKKVSFKHRRELPSADNIRMQVEEVLRQLDAYGDLAETFAQFRISKDAAKNWLRDQLFQAKEVEKEATLADGSKQLVKVMSEPSTRLSNRIDSLIKSYETTLDELGGESTAWTLWNALTRFSDHEGGIRKTEGRKEIPEQLIRYENNVLGNSAAFKEKGAEAIKLLIAA